MDFELVPWLKRTGTYLRYWSRNLSSSLCHSLLESHLHSNTNRFLSIENWRQTLKEKKSIQPLTNYTGRLFSRSSSTCLVSDWLLMLWQLVAPLSQIHTLGKCGRTMLSTQQQELHTHSAISFSSTLSSWVEWLGCEYSWVVLSSSYLASFASWWGLSHQ